MNFVFLTCVLLPCLSPQFVCYFLSSYDGRRKRVIQLCKENYSNCLWRKTDWALDIPKLGKASKISGDLRRSPEIVTSLWKSCKVFGWSSEIFSWSSEIFGTVRAIFGSTQVIFGNLWRCLDAIRKSSEVFGWSLEVFGIGPLQLGSRDQIFPKKILHYGL